jgi:hypothetical protein
VLDTQPALSAPVIHVIPAIPACPPSPQERALDQGLRL